MVGANDSGKSNLYRALRLLAETVQGGPVWIARCTRRRCGTTARATDRLAVRRLGRGR
ncbi:AAA family ATPase [Lysobacter cavernae]